jgi:hypothetical protein
MTYRNKSVQRVYLYFTKLQLQLSNLNVNFKTIESVRKNKAKKIF